MPVLSASDAGRAVEGQYIVVLEEGANPRSVAAVAGVSPRYVYTTALNGFAGTLNAGQLEALQHNPNVAYIEQDQEVSVASTQASATWGIDRVDQRALPLSTTYTYLNTGVGVTAYIIDTGIRFDHVEFGGRASAGYDAVTAGGTAADCQGHGVAAGNGNFAGIVQDACNYSPARVAEANTIGATTSSDAKASYSNYGACVDFFAPGSSITSANYSSATGSSVKSGTSIASPHVAGVAALYLQGNPGATPQQVRDALYAGTTKGVVTSAETANNHLLFSNY